MVALAAMVTGIAAGEMQRDGAGDLAVDADEVDDDEIAGLADAGGPVDHGAQRLRYRGPGVEEVHIDAARAVVAGRARLGDVAVLARPADAPGIHLADAVGPFLAQQAGEALVAQAAAGLDGVVQMMAPVVGRLFAERHRDRHLRHHGGAAASDQAAVGEQDLAPPRAASIAAYMPAPPDPITSTSVSTCMG